MISSLFKRIPNSLLANPDHELQVAASYGDNRKIYFLVSAFNKININSSSSEDGKTALHHAIQNAHLDSAELLLKHGADIAITDSHGNTPIKLMHELKQNSPEKFLGHAVLSNHTIVIISAMQGWGSYDKR